MKNEKYKKLSFLEKLFSITNTKNNKMIVILGIPFIINYCDQYKKLCLKTKVKENKIVFCNFKGLGYSCNPKYIAQEIIKRKLDYELVWLVNNPKQFEKDNSFPKQIRLVKFRSRKAFVELASAKLWVDNQRKLYHTFRGLTKKENQYYLQTWHGSLGIKQIGLASPLTKKENDWVPLGIKDSKMINIVLSNSKFDDDVLYENFFHNVKTEKLGHPRNDIFFKDNAPEIKKIKSYYNIPHDKKIILYVPSFRDYKGFEWNILDYPKILNAFRAKYQSDFIFLSRMHPRNIYQNKVLIPKSKDIINATHYPDIMELLASADVLISDYSSCMFDFILTKKPIFVLAADKDKFTEERGLYYPLESTPIPIAEDNETLEYNILNFDVEKYKKGVELFLNEKGCIEDGKASIRVVDKIEKIMEGKIDE